MKKKKVVFLDAGTTDWGDLNLQSFFRGFDFKAYRKTSPKQLQSRCQDANHIVTNKCLFDRSVLKALPESVQAIHIAATGVNNVDLQAAKACGVRVTNVAGYSTESVVGLTFAFILNLASGFCEYEQKVRLGEWSKSPFFTLPGQTYNELSGKTMGIVGYGNIGKRVAKVAQAFQMKVLIAKIPGRKYGAQKVSERVTLNRVLKESDFLSLHCPLSPETHNLIDIDQLAKMKSSAYLINMARGGIVNERALVSALKKKLIAGAGSDVTETEPPSKNHVYYGAPRMLLTPHIAWASLEARGRLLDEIVLNIKSFERGQRRNCVV